MKKSNAGIVVIIAILVSFICGGIGAYIITNFNSYDKVVTTTTGNNIKLSETDSISESVKKIFDSVVVIEGISNKQLISTGTGFVYKQTNKKSYIMTNHHVKILGVATLGNSEKMNVGDTVFTVGSPEGKDYAGTVTKGILSGKDRLVAVALSGSSASDYYMKVMQTDAAINPGNSGGPICNINGEVIGITNMKLVDNSVEGMGFAIPIEDALYYAAMLEKGNDVIRPYFGIGMLDIGDSYYLWQNGITIPKDVTSGVVISEVANNSPASRAGLKKGDIIISLAGEDIKSLAEFRYQLYRHKVGEEIVVKYIRDGKKQEVKVKLTKNDNK